MSRPISLAVILLAAVLLLPGCSTERSTPDESTQSATSNGDAPFPQAPSFERTTLSGTTVALDDWHGRVVVLNFWATWCAPCRAEIPRLITLQREFGEERVRFVGVSLDEAGTSVVRPYAEEMGINYPLIVDSTMALAQEYGGHYAVPTTFMIDAKGRIRQRYMRAVPEDELRTALQSLLADR